MVINHIPTPMPTSMILIFSPSTSWSDKLLIFSQNTLYLGLRDQIFDSFAIEDLYLVFLLIMGMGFFYVSLRIENVILSTIIS